VKLERQELSVRDAGAILLCLHNVCRNSAQKIAKERVNATTQNDSSQPVG
jgi:hypothetical protein